MSAVIELAPRNRLPPLDDARLSHFEAFVAALRPVFHRADQALRFRAYLRGLLEPMERKNVEAIAAAAGRAMMVETNLAQALQHFVSSSPWDTRRLLSAVRKQSADLRRDPDAVWVIHDGAFPKKGQHSVGVHRQFARAAGKKFNCQIGVFVAQVGPRGYFPLAAQLYLPAHWLKENGELAEKTIPEDFRRAASKVDIALALLKELQNDGETTRPVAAETGYLAASEFAEGLTSHGLTQNNSAQDPTSVALARLEWLKSELGLDHFEGRNWQGWHHHVGLVFVAYYLLAAEGGSVELPPFCTRPQGFRDE